MNQPNPFQADQQIAMMNALKGVNTQLASDGRIPTSQPVSPVAHQTNNGMVPFSTPAGLSTQPQQVHTRPRGMTVGTVPIMPMHLATGYQHSFPNAPSHNGNMHPPPEAVFHLAKHLPHTQGPSPMPVSPFNVQSRDTMVSHTAPPSPGGHSFAQDAENNIFMNAGLTTPQRAATASVTQQDSARSQPEFNSVPVLESHALAYGGLNMNEIRMSAPMSLSNSQTSLHASIHQGDSARSAEDAGAHRSTLDESRRSSGTGAGPGIGGMLHMSTLNGSQGPSSAEGPPSSAPPLTITTDSSQVEELSNDLKDKLTFLTKYVHCSESCGTMLTLHSHASLQNKLTAAINEAQLNHPMAVDEYLNDIKKAIVNKENEPRTPSTAASGSGQMSTFTSSVQRQASPLSMVQNANNRMDSATPINISLNASNLPPSNSHDALSSAMLPSTGGLLAPVELSRTANSTKRSAPESPMMEGEATTQNKHMRLEQDMEGVESSGSQITSQGQAGQPQTLLPPQLVHAHSFPQAGTVQQPMMAVPLNALPTLVGAMGQHISQTHTPVNPSPLSHVSNAHQNMPYGFGHPTGMPIPLDPSMQNWTAQHAMIDPNYPMQTMVPIQQPTNVGRRGSIVDGRLIAPRPRVGDARSMTTGAIPTMNSLGMTVISSSQLAPFTQSSAMDTEVAVEDGDLEDDDDSEDDEGRLKRRASKRRRSSDPVTAAPEGALMQPPDLISDEIRMQLDKIMYDFLNDICSDRE